jgi:membrane protease YdiL (CAAX protease family)
VLATNPSGATPAAAGAAAPPAPARTGAFGSVRTRWLLLWALLGGALLSILGFAVAELTGTPVPDELLGILLYMPIVAWVLFVARRRSIDLRVMFRWPRLGAFWWVVAGMLIVQLLFSIGAITLTQLVAPGLDDALEGVGQGNLVLALIGIVVVPPLVEETVFRGVLLERLSVKWRVGVAIVIAALLFGILHADPVGAGMFGVVTALLYLRTGSLWPGILIHAANNLIALVAMRAAGPEVAPPPADVSDSLVSAAIFLVLSVPFLVWFIRVNWPPRGTLTPYQWHELTNGLPTRRVDSVVWSGAAHPVRLEATSTHLVVADPGPSGGASRPVAVLPLERVRAAYPAFVPGGEQVVVLLNDGSWTTMHVRAGSPAGNRVLAQIISERVEQAAYRTVTRA